MVVQHGVMLTEPNRPFSLKLRSIAATLCVVGCAWPALAAADGYNDWSAELPNPGELWLVPALQFAPNPQPQTYAQLQFQCGLSERVDLIFATAGWIGAERNAFDATLFQPRIQVVEGLLFSPGLAIQGEAEGTRSSWMPGLFATLNVPSGWKINLNSIFYLPWAEPSAVELFAVVVVERAVGKAVSVYGEIDVFGSVGNLGSADIAGFLGVQFDVGDDTLNLMITAPLSPELRPGGLGLGLWWAHGFTIRPLTRRM